MLFEVIYKGHACLLQDDCKGVPNEELTHYTDQTMFASYGKDGLKPIPCIYLREKREKKKCL